MKRPRKSQAQTDARAQSRSKLKTNWQQKKEQTSGLHLQEPHQGLSSLANGKLQHVLFAEDGRQPCISVWEACGEMDSGWGQQQVDEITCQAKSLLPPSVPSGSCASTRPLIYPSSLSQLGGQWLKPIGASPEESQPHHQTAVLAWSRHHVLPVPPLCLKS